MHLSFCCLERNDILCIKEEINGLLAYAIESRVKLYWVTQIFFRAIFVENCHVVKNEVLFLPQSGKNRRKARKNALGVILVQNFQCFLQKYTILLDYCQNFLKSFLGVKPNTVVDPANIALLPKEDLFHPVLCSVCATNIGVYNYEEVFHFFNVLTGYA